MKRLTVAVLILAGLFVAGFYVLNTAKENLVQEHVKEKAPQKLVSAPITLGGYVINRGTSSIGSMQSNLNGLDVVIGDWAHFDGANFIIDDQSKQNQIIQTAKQIEKGIQVVGMVNNYRNGWRGTEVVTALSNQEKRTELINNITAFAKDNNFSAVAMDFESLPKEAEYLNFLNELHSKLNAEDKLLWVHLYFNDRHDYKRYAEYTDRIIVMAYDQHSSVTDPGPISGKPWLVENLKKVLSVVAADKVAVGFGSYAYDWQEGQKGRSISYAAAVQLAREQGQQIRFDQEQANSYFKYIANGQPHQIWLVDQNTVFELTKTVTEQGVRNILIYRFGSEDQRIWSALKEIKGE